MNEIVNCKDVLADVVIDIASLVKEAQETKVTVTVANSESVSKFNNRIVSILNYVENMFNEFDNTNDWLVASFRYRKLYAYIVDNYKYKEGTMPYRTINSILDVLQESWNEMYDDLNNLYNN